MSAPDDYTLKVQLDKPVPYFVSLTANFSLFPVNQAVVEKYGNDWTKVGNLVGNGAFKLQERVVNEKLVLTPNDHYWDHAQTVLTKVTFVPINQESNATKRYLAGDIDITESFPKNMYQKLLKDIPGQVYTPDQLGTYYYAFNTQRAPTNDVRVRQALSYAIDRKIIAEKVLGTGEKPAYHFTPDVTAGFKPEASLLQQQSQAELDAQAKALLQAAGYGPNNPLKLTLLYNTSESHQKIAIAVASMWKKKLGIDYDRLLAQAGRETNPAAVTADYNKMEQIIADQAPIAPIYQYTNGRLIKPWVKGYPITNPEDVAYSQKMYIIKH